MWLSGSAHQVHFGNYWLILAGAMLTVSHMAGVLGLTGHLYGIKQNYRKPAAWVRHLAPWLTLETMLIGGLLLLLAGAAILLGVVAYWSANSLGPIGTVLPAVAGTTLVATGMQNVLGGFLLSIVAGNDAAFLEASQRVTAPPLRTALESAA